MLETKEQLSKYREDILKAINDGDALKDISQKFKVPISRLSILIREENVSIISIRRNRQQKLVEKILKETNGILSLEDLSRYGLSSHQLRILNKAFGVKMIISGEGYRLRLKMQSRLSEIIKLIDEGHTLISIGKKFGVTKQRVSQVLIANNISSPREIRIGKKNDIFKNILVDWRGNMSIKDICLKYNLSDNKLRYMARTYGPNSILQHFKTRKERRLKRNNTIGQLYVKGNTAKSLTTRKNKLLDDPRRVNSENNIYKINSTLGIRRYPKIGNRHKGGVFLDENILKVVTKERQAGLSFDKIAEKLNKGGYKTVTGSIFYGPNLHSVYNKYLIKGFGKFN